MLFPVALLEKKYRLIFSFPNCLSCDYYTFLANLFDYHELHVHCEVIYRNHELELITMNVEKYRQLVERCRSVLNNELFILAELRAPSVYFFLNADNHDFVSDLSRESKDELVTRLILNNNFNHEVYSIEMKYEDDYRRWRIVLKIGEINRNIIVGRGGYIFFGGEVVEVFDNLGVRICGKCGRFNHMKNECMENDNDQADQIGVNSSLMSIRGYELNIVSLYQGYNLYTSVLMVPAHLDEI